MITMGDVTYLIDVVSGSAASLTPREGAWHVRQAGPVRLWDRVEALFDAYDAADWPHSKSFRLHVRDGDQRLRHPRLPDLSLPRP